jgi:hypothetical protein
VTLPYLWNLNTENSEYCENGRYCKNCYLSFCIVLDVENVWYSFHIKEWCTNVFNTYMARDNCSNIYQCSGILRSHNIFYSKNIIDSSAIYFSVDLQWCHECIFCDNLLNQSYCIRNKKYEKEEYLKLKSEIVQEKHKFLSYYNALPPSSSFIVESENIANGINVYRVSNARNVINTGSKWGNRNLYDLFLGGSPSGEDCYASLYIGPGEHIYCCDYVGWGQHNYHSFFLEECSYCLWCIWLKNKSFCILNKQYSKEERFELADKIFAQMERDWILWAFFPASMNPFYFNDTAAYLIDDSFAKEEVTKEWYLRRDEEIKMDVPANAEVITTQELINYQWFNPAKDGAGAQGERKINPEILKKVIKDEKWNYYRIVPMELDFLQKHRLPLPEIHRLDRIKLWFKFK